MIRNKLTYFLVFIILLVVTGITLLLNREYIYREYIPSVRVYTYDEIEKFIVECKVKSIGQSHNGIARGDFEIELVDGSYFRVDTIYKNTAYQKLSELESSGKCDPIGRWIE